MFWVVTGLGFFIPTDFKSLLRLSLPGETMFQGGKGFTLSVGASVLGILLFNLLVNLYFWYLSIAEID